MSKSSSVRLSTYSISFRFLSGDPGILSGEYYWGIFSYWGAATLSSLIMLYDPASFFDAGSKPNRRYLLIFSCSFSCFLLSYTYIPIIWSTSLKSIVLICLSRGDELLNEGHTFTSRSHGFNFSSRIISKPYSSKQALRCLVYFIFVTIWGSTAINVFMITSFILSKTCAKSTPIFWYSALSYFRHHFDELFGSSKFKLSKLVFWFGT